MESLRFRFVAASVEEGLENTGIIGGVLSRDIGKALLIQLLGVVVDSLNIFGKVVREGTGRWDKDFREIEGLHKNWRQSLEMPS